MNFLKEKMTPIIKNATSKPYSDWVNEIKISNTDLSMPTGEDDDSVG